MLIVFAALAFVSIATAQVEKEKEKDLNPQYSTAVTRLKTTCQTGKHRFDLKIGEEGKAQDKGEADERKMFGYPLFWIEPEKGESLSALPPKQYNEILFLKPQGQSICKDTVAFSQEDGTVAIFIRQNNRPFEDYLSVVFYDPAQQKVLASEREVAVADQVEKNPEGFIYKVEDLPTDVVTFTTTVHGQKLETIEDVFSYWGVVSLNNGKAVKKINRTLTWERSLYRSYFKSLADFDKAFSWDEKQQAYKVGWVYRVKNPDCIQPAIDRKIAYGDSHWFCGDKNVVVTSPSEDELKKCRQECKTMRKNKVLHKGMTTESCIKELCNRD